MFVSRKNLSLIHLFPREMPARPHRIDPAHELIEACRVRARRCVLRQPIAESVIQGLALVVSDLAGLIDQIFAGTEGDVSHECSVHDIRAHCKQLQLGRGFQAGFLPLLIGILLEDLETTLSGCGRRSGRR